MSFKQAIEEVINDLVSHRISIDEAVCRLTLEMGRGGRTLVVDENRKDLRYALGARGYTVDDVPTGADDHAVIKPQLNSRVFITANWKDFDDPADLRKYRYGLLKIPSRGDLKRLVVAIEKELMTAQFNSNLEQIKTVELDP